MLKNLSHKSELYSEPLAAYHFAKKTELLSLSCMKVTRRQKGFSDDAEILKPYFDTGVLFLLLVYSRCFPFYSCHFRILKNKPSEGENRYILELA